MLTVQQKQLLCALISEHIRVASWGITNIIIENGKISFNVNGFKYGGKIIIMTNSSECYYIIIGKRNIIKCHLDELIDTLDNIIEVSDDYIKHLENTIRSYHYDI